jgi:deoxyribonuclease IV
MMVRPVGLHLRNNEHLKNLSDKATKFNLTSFQCFLRHQNGTLISSDKEEIAAFKTFREQCGQLYAHASYKINLADARLYRHPALKEEIRLALILGFTHIIIHPGASQDTEQGITAIIRQLNYLTKNIHDITFVLENVAFGHPSVGGDLQELAKILVNLNRPESVGVCIDTAHAFAYGYDLTSDKKIEEFVDTLANTVTMNSIKLIHINDTQTSFGSRHDIHCRFGQGTIGQKNLETIIAHKALSHIPLLLELPAIDEHAEQEDLNNAISLTQL